MKIPTNIIMDSKPHPVNWVRSSEGHPSSGSYCSYYETINLHPLTEGLTEELQSETLLHEILERINNVYELHLEHRKISTISSQLFAAMRTNKLNFS